MTFGLAQTRYSTDDSGVVHDNLVEYCIDTICGWRAYPVYFPFALNRVFREYLFADDAAREEHPYWAIQVILTEHGIVFDHPHNFMEDLWSDHLPSSFYFAIRQDDAYQAEWMGTLDGRSYLFTSGPVSLVGDDLQDLTFVLACLLLCRDISTKRLTSRYRNNHKVATNGKDKAQK